MEFRSRKAGRGYRIFRKMNNWKYFGVLLLALLSVPKGSHAQFTMAKTTDVAQVKSRQLIVLLDAASKKEKEKFAKKDKSNSSEALEKAYSDYNTTLESIVKKNWKLHDTFQTMQLDDFKALDKNEKKKYVVIFCSSYDEAVYNNTFIPVDHLVLDPTTSRFAKSFTHPVFSVCPGEKLDQKISSISPQIFSIDLPEDQPVGSALAFAVRLANYFCTTGYQYTIKSKSTYEIIARQNDYKLATKTLLLRRDWMQPGLSEKEVQYLYRYPSKVVTVSEYDSLVVSGDPQYVYFVIIPKATMNMNNQNYISYYYLIADNQDGALCAFYLPNMILSKYKTQYDKTLLDDKTLKKIADTYH